MVQFINKRMIIHRAFYIAHLFIISKCKQRFRLNRHVTILYPSPNNRSCIDVPVRNRRQLRSSDSYSYPYPTFYVSCLHRPRYHPPYFDRSVPHRFFSIAYAILTIQLRFHYLKLIRLGSFTVSNFFTRFSTLVIHRPGS